MPSFDRAAVILGGKGSHQHLEFEPDDDQEEITYGRFYVRGRFRIAEKENRSRRAQEKWEEFRVEKGDGTTEP